MFDYLSEDFDLKPFDLEAAKNGAEVITRDGRAVRLLCFDRKSEDGPIVGLVYNADIDEEFERSWYCSGQFYKDKDNKTDLFMKPVKKTGWVNVYDEPGSCRVGSFKIYASKEAAEEGRGGSHAKGQAIKIEWQA